MSHSNPSVADLARDLLGEAAAQDIIRDQQAGTLNLWLANLRLQRGLTIEETANRLGWAVDEVRMLEESTAEDITADQLLRYTKAVGYEMDLLAWPENTNLTERVRTHLAMATQHLAKIAELVGNDQTMREGLADTLKSIVTQFSEGMTQAIRPLGSEFLLSAAQRFQGERASLPVSPSSSRSHQGQLAQGQ